MDRPCPAATGKPALREWSPALRFQLQRNHVGRWNRRVNESDDWILPTCFGQMQLFQTNFGHLGVFPEQIMHWEWITGLPLAGLKLLNLFAYTGGSTLAAARAGAQVTHVDSARNIVRRASENARLSRLQDYPIRWIVEDARKFVARELKRGNHYDGVILDPPTYGHGTSSKSVWKIDEAFGPLIEQLAQLIPDCRLLLMTCHSQGYTPQKLTRYADELKPQVNEKQIRRESGTMMLQAESGSQLASGSFARWCSVDSAETTQVK